VTRRKKHSAHCEVDAIHWSQYLDGEFSSAKCRQCEVHLAGCADCREKLRDVRATVKTLRAASRQPLPASVKAAIRKQARTLLKGTR
jgi:anti-sigma factor RsiW